jgi:hypothetical protein
LIFVAANGFTAATFAPCDLPVSTHFWKIALFGAFPRSLSTDRSRYITLPRLTLAGKGRCVGSTAGCKIRRTT